MPKDIIDGKTTLVRVMAWCHQAKSHYLSQCWPRSMSLPEPMLTEISDAICCHWATTSQAQCRYCMWSALCHQYGPASRGPRVTRLHIPQKHASIPHNGKKCNFCIYMTLSAMRMKTAAEAFILEKISDRWYHKHQTVIWFGFYLLIFTLYALVF